MELNGQLHVSVALPAVPLRLAGPRRRYGHLGEKVSGPVGFELRYLWRPARIAVTVQTALSRIQMRSAV